MNYTDHPDWPTTSASGWQESTWTPSISQAPRYYGGPGYSGLETRRIPQGQQPQQQVANPFETNAARNAWAPQQSQQPQQYGFNQFGLETRRTNNVCGVNPWAQGKQTMPQQPQWQQQSSWQQTNCQYPNPYDSGQYYNWGDTLDSWDNKQCPTWGNWMVQPQQMVAPKVNWDYQKNQAPTPYGWSQSSPQYPLEYHQPQTELSWGEEVKKNWSTI